MSFHLGYRPALDGVRGLAILTVMVVHTGSEFISGGFLSVDLFFVLSGFLITSVLLEEWDKHDTIRLKPFYIRRGLRLLPGLMVLLLGLYAFSFKLFYLPEVAAEIRREILFTFFYVTNWALAFGAMPAVGMLGHAWTLAIEEQFYLAWPLLLLLLLRAGLSRRAIAWLTAAAIAIAAVHRTVMFEQGATLDRLFFGFDTRCDTLLAGCLAGLYASFPGRDTPRARAVLRVASFSAIAVLAFLWATASRDAGYMYRGGFTLVALAAALVLLEVVDHPRAIVARLLSWPPLVHAGHISYGLYLWHWPVFLFLLPANVGWSVGTTNIVRFAVTFALAELSARLIEQPFLRQKARWT